MSTQARAGLPPELFTAGHVTPPESLYEQLAEEFPQYVRRNDDGEWEIDVWADYGVFSPAIKAFHARSRSVSPRELQLVRLAELPRVRDGFLDEAIPVRSVWRRRDAHPAERRMVTGASWEWVSTITLGGNLGHGGCSLAHLLDNYYLEGYADLSNVDVIEKRRP